MNLRRYQDSVIVLHGTNYELSATEHCMRPNASDERGFVVAEIQQRHGFVLTRPDTFTWSNSRGPSPKIDFFMVCTPSINLASDQVHVDSDFLLGCDHRAVSTSFRSTGPKEPQQSRSTRPRNRCGRWKVDGAKAIKQCNQLAEQMELHGRDFNVDDLQRLSDSVSFRPKSHTIDIKTRSTLPSSSNKDDSFRGPRLDGWVRTFRD